MMRARHAIQAGALGLGMGVCALPAGAAVCDWRAHLGGSYGSPANWSPKGVPTAADAVRFDLSGAYTVHLDSSRSAQQFQVGNDMLVFDMGGSDFGLLGYESPGPYVMLESDEPSLVLGLNSGDQARVSLVNGTFTSYLSILGAASGSDGNVTVRDNGIWNVNDLLSVGNVGSGGLTITGGGAVHAAFAQVGTGPGTHGRIVVSGEDASFTVDGDLLIGSEDTTITGQVVVRGGAAITVAGAIDVRDGGLLRLEGGFLTAGSLESTGEMNLIRGTLDIGGEISVLDDGALTLDGATLRAASISGRGPINFLSGVLDITGPRRELPPGGDLGDDIYLPPEQAGKISRKATLAASAHLRLDGGDFNAEEMENFGQITLSHNALLRGSLINRGRIAGTGVVVDPIVNFGQFVAENGQELRFNGSVVHHGQAYADPSSSLVFYGGVTGAGEFDGGGNFRFRNTYSPGNSPGDISVVGNLIMEPASILIMEIGGSAYDQIHVSGNVTVANVQISLLDDFAPTLGASYTLIDAGGLMEHTGLIYAPSLPYGYAWSIEQNTQLLVAQIIPEPSAMLLAAMGAAGLILRRRRV